MLFLLLERQDPYSLRIPGPRTSFLHHHLPLGRPQGRLLLPLSSETSLPSQAQSCPLFPRAEFFGEKTLQ